MPGVPDPDATAVIATARPGDGRAEHSERAFLVAADLTARGPEGPIFADVSFTADAGDLIGITGEAGTGRTTLLLCLAGRFAHGGGSVTIDGRRRPAELRELVTVAVAPPAVTVDGAHTVADIVAETKQVGGARVGEESIRQALAVVGVAPDSGTAFELLPRVEQILLLIAMAAAHRTPVIAVDDIDAGLDRANAERVWTALRTLADHDYTVIATAVTAGMVDVPVHLPRPDELAAEGNPQ